MTASAPLPRTRASTLADDVLAVAPAWLVARVLVLAGGVAAVAVADRLVPGARPDQIGDGLLAWDGAFYRDIAIGGYARTGIEGLRFFPLFPLIGRVVTLGVDPAVGPALVVIANVCSFAALVLVRRLVVLEGKGLAVAQRAVWYTALFPAAFVLAWGYAEALMLLAVVGGFLAMRRQAWGWAAVAGVVAAGSRPLGVLLAVPAAIEVARAWSASSPGKRALGVVAVGAPVAVLGAYLLWVGAEYDDSLLPFRVQDELRGTTLNPIDRLGDGLGQLFGPERFGDGLHIPFAVLFVVLVALTFRYWPVSYGAFAALVVLAALSADNLNSLERYGLNAFPIVLTLAVLARDDRVDRAVLAVAAGGVVALSSLAWLGAYVP